MAKKKRRRRMNKAAQTLFKEGHVLAAQKVILAYLEKEKKIRERNRAKRKPKSLGSDDTTHSAV